MKARITFFPVGNGNMTLIRLADANTTRILVDAHFNLIADGSDLRERLNRDSHGRPFVDAFLLSNPSPEHCTGLRKHFHLGPLFDYPDDEKSDSEKKIIIREIWYSPLVFRRSSRNQALCNDAAAFQAEAERRVQMHLDMSFNNIPEGDRILIMGADLDGHTDNLTPILIETGETFSRINAVESTHLSCQLLTPIEPQDVDTEIMLSKNRSSVVMSFTIAANNSPYPCRYLSCGDAGVAILEWLWQRNLENKDVLMYDIMLVPHNCSWGSLSYDSWLEKGKAATVSPDALSALSQTHGAAYIIASCKPVLDTDNGIPCIAAKHIYQTIAKNCGGVFYCTGEHLKDNTPTVLEFEISENGIKPL